jgi:signal transduction histidine kinase
VIILDAVHEQAQDIFDTARESLLLLDSQFRVRTANRAFYETFHVSPAETLGRLVFELGDGHWNIPRLRTALADIIPHNAELRDFEVESDFENIGRRCMVLNARRIGEAGGAQQLVFVAIEDITEKRATQDALWRLNAELEVRVRERTAELEAANKELEAFCYSVSHDLRAPLRGIDGFSQELVAAYASQIDDQGRHYLSRIRAGTQRMAQLIDDLLQLSQLTRDEMHRQPVAIGELAQTIADGLRQDDPTRQVVFSIDRKITAHGDPRLLRVALENLLGNAWKFTARQSRATIEFAQDSQARPNVYWVRDNGVGFDMAFAAKLFGAFQRLHGDRDFPGTGIGLATVQRVVHRHGGRIWAESAVGRGATFYFTLGQKETP